MSAKPTAYSYIRFSGMEQSHGDSLRRQTDGSAEDFCRRHDLHLDTTLTLHDLGVSAFRGKHRDDNHNLGRFLDLVKRGRVAKGSYLLIENLDRLTREEERPALRLWMDILDAGVNVVQLKPETIFRHEKSDMFDIMRAIMELSRGHGESKRKSDLLSEAWGEKKVQARNGVVMTARLPAWVRNDDGRLVLIPEAAESVREVFRLARSGYGIPSIVAKLEADGVRPIGRTGRWTRSYVGVILKDRRALGEYQPRRGKEKDGDVVRDYYPAAITADEWNAARAGAAQRLKLSGDHPRGVRSTARREKRAPGGEPAPRQVNVFQGLLWNAREGDTYIVTQRLSKSGGKVLRRFPVLINSNADQGRSRAWSIPYLPFERAVLSLLREIDPAEVLGTDEPDESQTLGGEFSQAEAELAEATAFMNANGFSPAIGKRVKTLEDRLAELTERLRVAEQKAASPLSASWGEAQTLAAAIDSAPDQRDARIRLRGAIRRIVSGVWLLVVPRGHDRLAAVQVRFGEKHRRDYLILHRPASGTRKASGTWWHSLPPALSAGLALDLRQRDHAKRLERQLEALDLGAFGKLPIPEEKSAGRH